MWGGCCSALFWWVIECVVGGGGGGCVEVHGISLIYPGMCSNDFFGVWTRIQNHSRRKEGGKGEKDINVSLCVTIAE